ncbi:MAG TPA: sensor histidine kinase, partial [Brevundimonas sp.]|nr:sensor histidine kinase [Brevundimonas sp.]
MIRLGRALTKGVGGRGLRPSRFQGIRFRLGSAMAIALLPVLVLGAIQAQSDFRTQDVERRQDLQLAAERTASSAKAQLDSTGVLLQALRPEQLDLYCEPRLSDLVRRLENLDGLARVSATGQTVCASRGLTAAAPPWMGGAASSEWFLRLRSGEGVVLARATAAPGQAPGLIVAIRLERPLG